MRPAFGDVAMSAHRVGEPVGFFFLANTPRLGQKAQPKNGWDRLRASLVGASASEGVLERFGLH